MHNNKGSYVPHCREVGTHPAPFLFILCRIVEVYIYLTLNLVKFAEFWKMPYFCLLYFQIENLKAHSDSIPFYSIPHYSILCSG